MRSPLSKERAAVLALLCWLGGPAGATEQSVGVQTTPTAMTLGLERLRLPGSERMGLLGVQYLFEPTPGLRFGPAAYGAASGQRGGLFTWGGEVQGVLRFSPEWQATAGLYVGGGGGAAAPVGGGLMLRPHVDLWRRLDGWQVGLSASEVRFPSGSISSSQLGLMLAFDDSFRYTGPDRVGQRVRSTGRAGVGFDRVQVVLGRYQWRSGATGSMSHVGMRLDRRLGEPMSGLGGAVATAGLEAAGAAQGGADGYAEGLGTLGLEWPIGGAAVGVRGALGLAGGGAVPTRGGGIGKLAANAVLPLGRQWLLGAEVGRMQALQGPLRGDYAQINLGFVLDRAGRDAPADDGVRRVTGARWGLALESYTDAARKAGGTRGMQTIGLRFDRAIGEQTYWTGQAHSAIAGGAGAYSIGLLGVGGGLALAPGWRAGAEMLAGAAGGGGVAIQGGAVVQPMLWASRELGSYSRLQVGVGQLRSLKGDLSTPVLDLTWLVAFGLPERH